MVHAGAAQAVANPSLETPQHVRQVAVEKPRAPRSARKSLELQSSTSPSASKTVVARPRAARTGSIVRHFRRGLPKRGRHAGRDLLWTRGRTWSGFTRDSGFQKRNENHRVLLPFVARTVAVEPSAVKEQTRGISRATKPRATLAESQALPRLHRLRRVKWARHRSKTIQLRVIAPQRKVA
jgi:hypothetical protein